MVAESWRQTTLFNIRQTAEKVMRQVNYLHIRENNYLKISKIKHFKQFIYFNNFGIHYKNFFIQS